MYLKAGIFLLIGLVLLVIIALFGKRYIYFYPIKAVAYYNKPDWVKEIWVDHIHCWLASRNENSIDNSEDNNDTIKKRKLVIHCHGNAGNIGDRDWLINKFDQAGADLLLFDYSGFGMSGKTPNENQLYSDASSVFDHCVKNLGYSVDNIIMYGESIGCPVAMKIADQKGVSKIILQSGPHSIYQFVWDHFPWGIASLLSWLVYNDFTTHKSLERFNGKCLIIHGEDDTLIKKNHAEMLNKCGKNSELVLVKGGHNELELDWGKILSFIG